MGYKQPLFLCKCDMNVKEGYEVGWRDNRWPPSTELSICPKP